MRAKSTTQRRIPRGGSRSQCGESKSATNIISNALHTNCYLNSAIGDTTPLPPLAVTQEEDDALFKSDPLVEGPIRLDYGIHVTVGQDSFIGPDFTVLDTCRVTIGARVLIGPSVSIYTATHPVDPATRQGIVGPELGKEISIEDDCWIGGGAYILPGVTIGRGVTVGSGSVVTKSVEAFTVVAGNPARVIRRLENNFEGELR